MNEVGFSYSKHSWHGVSKDRVGEPCVVTRATLQLGVSWEVPAPGADRQTDRPLWSLGSMGSALQQHRVFGVSAELHLSACSTCVMWILAGLDAKPSETIFWEADSFLGCVLCHSCSKLVLIQGHLHPDAEFGLEFYNEYSNFFAFPECLELFFLTCWNMIKKCILVHYFTYFIVFYMSGILKDSYTSCQISCVFCPLCMLK